MKKNTVSLFIAASALVLMAGCAGGTKNSTIQTGVAESDSQAGQELDAEMSASEESSTETGAFDWLPTGIEQVKAETEPNEELRKLIVEYYEIPEDELADSRYYYDFVDLDGDGENEIFAVVVGSYTSGSGGSSALWCAQQDGALAVKQAFTLVNMPVIVVDNEEGGAKDLILERSGGGAESERVVLTCTDGIYTNVSDAEPVSALESVQGVAILCNDLADDMQTGSYLTLEPAAE